MKAWIYFLNTLIIVSIGYFQTNAANDKTIIITSLVIAILFVLNFTCGVIAQLDNRPVFKHFYFSAVLSVLLGLIVVGL